MVDMGRGTVTSDQPVDVKLLNGTLTADTMHVTEKGDVVRFENNVVMHLVMDRPVAAADPADKETTSAASAERTHSHSQSRTRGNPGGETK
jgi:lipopolysaccharide export system protein LptC